MVVAVLGLPCRFNGLRLSNRPARGKALLHRMFSLLWMVSGPNIRIAKQSLAREALLYCLPVASRQRRRPLSTYPTKQINDSHGTRAKQKNRSTLCTGRLDAGTNRSTPEKACDDMPTRCVFRSKQTYNSTDNEKLTGQEHHAPRQPKNRLCCVSYYIKDVANSYRDLEKPTKMIYFCPEALLLLATTIAHRQPSSIRPNSR